jgi:hypothetical protein
MEQPQELEAAEEMAIGGRRGAHGGGDLHRAEQHRLHLGRRVARHQHLRGDGVEGA